MRLLPVVLLLTACAAQPARTTYRQGAFPAPAEFSPVENAPHTMGQPGYAGEPQRLPRGTDRRVLPQTPDTMRAPGLWAAGSSDEGVKTAVPLFGYHLAMPQPSDAEDATRVFACSKSLRDAAAKYLVAISRMDERVRACMAADLYAHCAGGGVRIYEAHRSAGSYFDAAELARQRRLADAAEKDKAIRCKPPLLGDAARMASEIKEAWTREWEVSP